MLLSAKHRRQNNNASHNPNHPSSDFQESTQHHNISQEKTSQPEEEDSLVEHVLDFLDKYPVCFARRAPLTEYVRA